MNQNTDTTTGAVYGTEYEGSMCCEPMLMFDRLGNQRTRFVRISHNGAYMVMTPEDAQCFKEESEIGGDEMPYILTDAYLSKEEFEDLPEFDGF